LQEEDATLVRSTSSPHLKQGCQMVHFQTKNPNLGIFFWALECKVLFYFMTIWNILWQFGTMYWRLV
jgi:hypothetical protein